MTTTVQTDTRIFICADCHREHRAPSTDLPQGWDKIERKGRAPVIRCPDCAEISNAKGGRGHD